MGGGESIGQLNLGEVETEMKVGGLGLKVGDLRLEDGRGRVEGICSGKSVCGDTSVGMIWAGFRTRREGGLVEFDAVCERGEHVLLPAFEIKGKSEFGEWLLDKSYTKNIGGSHGMTR